MFGDEETPTLFREVKNKQFVVFSNEDDTLNLEIKTKKKAK